MGYYFGYGAEFAAILVVTAIQWHLGQAAILYIKGNLPAKIVRPSTALVRIGMGGILLGLILSLPNASSLKLNPLFFGWIRGISLLWAFTSTSSWMLYRALRLFRRKSDDINPTRRALLRAASSAAVAAPFALFGFGAFVERTAFRVRELDVPIADLHPDLEGLRLVQLSDIHLSAYLSEQEFARVVDAANELRAHVLFITGDLISTHGDPLDACLHQLSRLRADAGALGCLGNHEIYAQSEAYTQAEGARLGIHFLRSQARQLRFGKAMLNIGGVDYQKIRWRPRYLLGAERLISPGALNIMLSHNPDVFPQAAAQGWDLTLAGHTHGGQVNFEILHHNLNVARFYTPYVYGLYQSGRAATYVTRGIGTIGMPARLGAPPEIALLRLRRA
jgi:predicted MPP superfamily phosphohydrolase